MTSKEMMLFGQDDIFGPIDEEAVRAKFGELSENFFQLYENANEEEN
jgi:hypothetical protein